MTFDDALAIVRPAAGRAASNYETGLRLEMRRVVRCFYRYDTDQICNLANGRGNRRKLADRGEFYYTHPDVPWRGFHKRSDAARHAMESPIRDEQWLRSFSLAVGGTWTPGTAV